MTREGNLKGAMKTRPSIVRSVGGGLLVVGGSLAIWDSWKPLNRLFVYLDHHGHIVLGILAGFLVVIGICLLLAGRKARAANQCGQSENNGTKKKKKGVAGAPGYPEELTRAANQIKAALQMAIGIYALGWLAWSFYLSHRLHNCAPVPANSIHEQFCYLIPSSTVAFKVVADALAAATVVQLAYTLFTPGPDEALDPVMLALATALLLGLGQVSGFKWQDGVAIILYAAGLGVLFMVRIFLAPDKGDPPEWWWRKKRVSPPRSSSGRNS
jgi:hypothetical protein